MHVYIIYTIQNKQELIYAYINTYMLYIRMCMHTHGYIHIYVCVYIHLHAHTANMQTYSYLNTWVSTWSMHTCKLWIINRVTCIEHLRFSDVTYFDISTAVSMIDKLNL